MSAAWLPLSPPQSYDKRFTVPAAVHAVASTDMHSQLNDAFAYRRTVTKISSLYLPQANSNTRLGHFVTQGVEPCGERFTSIFTLISKKLYHGRIVA